MPNIFFQVFLLLSHGRLTCPFNISSSESLVCTIFSGDCLAVFQEHFRLINFLTVKVLQNNYTELSYLANSILRILENFHHTIKIQEFFLPWEVPTCKLELNHAQGRELKSNDEIIKIRKLTADPGEGHLIIAPNPEISLEFLEKYSTLIIPRARSTYFVLFASATSKESIHKFLNHVWTEFHLLNIIIQAPCLHPNEIFIYRPFFKTKSLWGTTQNFTFQEIIKNPKLITQTTKNLNQFPVKISLFAKSPAAIKAVPEHLKLSSIYKNLSLSKECAGSDAMLVGTLAEYLNFHPVINTDLPEADFGHVLPNGSIHGVLADVVNRKTDYGANRRLMTLYTIDGFEFTVPYSSDKISVAVPKSEKVPRGHSLFVCFDKLSWAAIFVIGVVCTLFWYFLRSSASLFKAMREVCAFLMGVQCRVVPSISQFMFLKSCMMFNLIIFGIIQGSLYTDFTTTSYYPEMDTLEDVDRSEMSTISFVWLIVKDNRSEIINRLKKRTIQTAHPNMLEPVAFGRNVVVIDRKFDMEIAIKTKFTGIDGIPLVHIVDESIISLSTSAIVPKGSPFLPMFNRVIMNLFEGGFIRKWDNDVIYTMILEQRGKMIQAKEKAFTLEDIHAAFYVIVIGYTCAILAFVGEVLWKCKRNYSNK